MAATDIIIDHPDEARDLRADLDARSIANKVFFTQGERVKLTALALAPFDPMGDPGDRLTINEYGEEVFA